MAAAHSSASQQQLDLNSEKMRFDCVSAPQSFGRTRNQRQIYTIAFKHAHMGRVGSRYRGYGTVRDGPERHNTLAAYMKWQYNKNNNNKTKKQNQICIV